MIEISIIVPIYKVESYLNGFIENILSQTHTNFELILVDDGSPDNCGAICDYYKTRDLRIKVIHQENKGSGMARNSGLSAAVGKYIYFCDPDDYLEDNLLEDNFRLAEKYQANMVIFGYYDEIIKKNKRDSHAVVADSVFLKTKNEFREKFGELHKKNLMFTLWNKLYRRDFIEKYQCRFENQKVGQDTIFNYKVYRDIDRVYINNNTYYHYVITRSGSAVNLYRKNRFELRSIGTARLEDLLQCWGYTKKFESVILNDWLKTLYVGLNNLFFHQCPLDDEEKKKNIFSIIRHPRIQYMLNNISPNSIPSYFMRKVIALLKKNKVSLVIQLFKIKYLVKK